MPRCAVVPALLFFLLAAAWPARAQSPSRGTVFIGAGGFASVEKAPTSRGLGVPQNDRSGTVAGGGLSIGVHLTPRVSARFEWGLTDTLKQSTSLGVNPLATVPVLPGGVGTSGNVTGGLPTQSLVVSQDFERKIETMTGMALLGFHVPAGRASIELLGGLGFVNQDTQERYSVRFTNPLILPFPQPEYRTSTYHAVAVAGADIAVSLTDHAAVVPSFRAFVLNGGLTMRPGLGLRWTF
jgi:hypothetical protein